MVGIMPSVLLLFEYPTLLGGEQSLLAALPWVREAGFRFCALAPARSPLARELARQGVEVHAWASAHGGAQQSLEDRRNELAHALERLRPDLLHANSLAMSRLSGPVARELGTPSIGHLRDILSLRRQATKDLNCHVRLLAVSHATRSWHVAQGVDAGKTLVCYNGVDLKTFCPRPPTGFLHHELQLPPEARLMGSIGQIGMRKGLDTTMEAFRRVAVAHGDLHWIIAGERSSTKDEALRYEERLHEAALTPPLVGRVHFLGVRGDAPAMLNELTMLVHAARQEPLGRVLLEAAAAGVPIIASDVGGTREILPADVFGKFLVPADEPAALACAMQRLAFDATERIHLAECVRQRAEEAFDIRRAAQNLAAHYGDVLNRA